MNRARHCQKGRGERVIKHAALILKYPSYAALINRVDVLICSGSHPGDLLPDTYNWIDKHMQAEDRPTARAKLEAFCRLRAKDAV